MDDGTTILTVGGAVIVGVITAMATVIANKSSAVPKAQEALNQSFQQFIAATNQRIAELEATIHAKDARVSYLEGLIAGLRIHVMVLKALLMKNGIDVPIEPDQTNIIHMNPGDSKNEF